MSMEFWGVEVKPGQPLKVTPEDGRIVHISQAALGEGKKEKGNDLIPLRLKIDNKKFIVASLSAESFPQITFDLVFEKEFELSHDWKNGSVYFCGYQIDNPTLSSDDDGDFDSSEEDELPVNTTENGKIEPKVEKDQLNASKSTPAKPESSAKPKVTVVEPKKDDESEDDESDDDEDEDDSDDDDLEDLEGDEDLPVGMDTEDSDDDSDDDVTPVAGKKRPTTSAAKTPTPAKKVKLASPLKSGKKGGQTATPHPSKQVGKTPANSSSKSKEQTPKSGGQVPCKSCSKTFNSENALQSHTKAKHSGK